VIIISGDELEFLFFLLKELPLGKGVLSMSRKLLILFFIVQIGYVLVSCSRDNNIVNSGSTDNLLSNPSFEKNGSPSLGGWIQSYQDTSAIQFS